MTDKLRPKTEIAKALNEAFEKVWLGRHMVLHEKDGTECPRAELGTAEAERSGCQAADRIQRTYTGLAFDEGDDLGDLSNVSDDFDWGRLAGRLETLRWVFGCDWNDLDT